MTLSHTKEVWKWTSRDAPSLGARYFLSLPGPAWQDGPALKGLRKHQPWHLDFRQREGCKGKEMCQQCHFRLPAIIQNLHMWPLLAVRKVLGSKIFCQDDHVYNYQSGCFLSRKRGRLLEKTNNMLFAPPQAEGTSYSFRLRFSVKYQKI